MRISTPSDVLGADVTLGGDPTGFVKVLDRHTLLVPGFDGTKRTNGRAELTRDPTLLDLMAVKERVPKLAIVVHVDEIFLRCATEVRRAGLWDVAQHQDRSDLPSVVKMILDQTGGAPTAPKEPQGRDEHQEESCRSSMHQRRRSGHVIDHHQVLRKGLHLGHHPSDQLWI